MCCVCECVESEKINGAELLTFDMADLSAAASVRYPGNMPCSLLGLMLINIIFLCNVI